MANPVKMASFADCGYSVGLQDNSLKSVKLTNCRLDAPDSSISTDAAIRPLASWREGDASRGSLRCSLMITCSMETRPSSLYCGLEHDSQNGTSTFGVYYERNFCEWSPLEARLMLSHNCA